MGHTWVGKTREDTCNRKSGCHGAADCLTRRVIPIVGIGWNDDTRGAVMTTGSREYPTTPSVCE